MVTTAILADGAPPMHPAARAAFDAASRLVCCDGAYRKARALGRLPDLVVGDGDSLSVADRAALGERFVLIAEQETNDLDKAFRTAVARFGGAGIGSGASFYGGTNHGGYNIRITGGTVTAIGEAGTSKDGTPIYNGAAGIGGGGEYCFGRNISITGGEVTAAGNGGGAAIGGSRLGEGCTVKISKDAIVHAAMSVTSDGKYTGPCFGDGAGSDADGKEITPDYSALRKGGLVEFFDPDGKLLRSYSLDTPSGVLK